MWVIRETAWDIGFSGWEERAGPVRYRSRTRLGIALKWALFAHDDWEIAWVNG